MAVDLYIPEHRGTSLIRNRPPLKPYSRPTFMPKALRWFWGGGALFLVSEVPL